MAGSDARASDEDVSQGLAALREGLLSRLRADAHGTTKEELDKIEAQPCEFTLELMQETNKLRADTIEQLKDKIKRHEDSIKQLEEDMGQSEKVAKLTGAFIERRRMEVEPAREGTEIPSLLQVYNPSWAPDRGNSRRRQ